MEIYFALTKYQALWDLGASKSLEILAQIKERLGSIDDWETIRERTRKAPLPSIPYVDLFLHDLSDVKVLSNDVRHNVINFEKRMILADIIKALIRMQKERYFLAPVLFIREMIIKKQILDSKIIAEKVKAMTAAPKPQKAKKTKSKKFLLSSPLSKKREHKRAAWQKSSSSSGDYNKAENKLEHSHSGSEKKLINIIPAYFRPKKKSSKGTSRTSYQKKAVSS